MSHLLDKIINPKLQIDPICTDVENEVIKLYWVFDSNLRLINKPTDLCATFGISLIDFRQLILKRSRFIFYFHCVFCDSHERQQCNSQTNFKFIVSSLRGLSNKFKCSNCTKQEKANRAIKREKDREKQALSHNHAINNKVWKNLSDFDNKVLQDALKALSFIELKKIYWKKLGAERYKDFFTSLRNLSEVDLIALHTNEFDSFKIENIQYSNRLVDEYDYSPKANDRADKGSQVSFNTETNEIRFKLTINKNRNHQDSPEYSGLVTFKERIVIEPNVEYLFGQWQRSNNELYLTMIPMDEIEKTPLQKRVESQPLPIREKIEAFLNSISKDSSL
jgi:hypothetical protein